MNRYGYNGMPGNHYGNRNNYDEEEEEEEQEELCEEEHGQETEMEEPTDTRKR